MDPPEETIVDDQGVELHLRMVRSTAELEASIAKVVEHGDYTETVELIEELRQIEAMLADHVVQIGEQDVTDEIYASTKPVDAAGILALIDHLVLFAQIVRDGIAALEESL